jgi:hypothetical protein
MPCTPAHTHRRPAPLARRPWQAALALALLGSLAGPPAWAGDGKLLLTGGVSSIDGEIGRAHV